MQDFFKELQERIRKDREKRLTWIQKHGLRGSRRQPYMPTDTYVEEAGTVVRKGTRKTREKVLKCPRTVTRCMAMSTGKYIPAGKHMRLGRANVERGNHA